MLILLFIYLFTYLHMFPDPASKFSGRQSVNLIHEL